MSNSLVIVDPKYFTIEEEKLPVLEKYFKKELKLTDQYNVVDYVGDNIQIEIKTRNCKALKYMNTMIPMNKINHLLKIPEDGYVVFNFEDGIYEMLVNKENLRYCELNQKGGRSDGHYKMTENGYCYIPVRLLTKIEFVVEFE